MEKNKRTRVMFVITQVIFAAILIGFVAVYVLTNRTASASQDRSTLIAMLTIGLGLCFCGILFNIAKFDRHDIRIRIAEILGAVLLVIFLGTLFGFFAFHDFRILMYITLCVMLAKIALTTIHHL